MRDLMTILADNLRTGEKVIRKPDGKGYAYVKAPKHANYWAVTFGTYQRLDVHVFASDREVIRAARRKLKREFRRRRAYRPMRHAFYREMLQYHHAARDLVVAFRL